MLGKRAIVPVIASRTAAAPCPASAGAGLGARCHPMAVIGGRCSNIVKRVVRYDQGPDRRALQTQDQASLPVTR